MMRKNHINKIFGFLVVVTMLFVGCTEEMSEVRLDPTLSTPNVFKVSSDSATVVGYVVAEGDGFTERGVCYNTSGAPTVDDTKVVYTGDKPTATFNVVLPGLNFATKYYARAYAVGGTGTVYGEEITFTTKPVVPFLTTVEITDITGNSASGGGEVTGTGGAEVTARGVVFGTEPNPTVADNKTEDGDGTGAFESALTGMLGNTTYYVRAYAENSAGTGYGPEVTFKTLVDLPGVTTLTATGITKTSASTGGVVTYDGGDEVTARGLAWGLNSDPTIADNVIDGGAGLDTFRIDLSNLEKYTTYHVRAYATNSAGTAYGEDVQFTTLADILTWYIPGDYVEASYPGSGMTNWSPDNSPYVMSTIDNGTWLEGYVYMSNSNNQWKFATQPNWDGPNYGDGGGGVLDAGAGNINSPAGYYKLNADAAAGTFTAVATEWGVIGSASPMGWDDETPLSYDPALTIWKGGIHLTNAEIKFRANHNWSYNYGSDAADGTLGAGAANIPIDMEADYAVTLDLSTPNEYTYAVHRWGIVGGATPDPSWGSDFNMTWDAVNGVFTITIDLTAGEFKFRADDGWDVNLGGSLDNLEPGGGNLSVAEDGNYTVTLDPWNRTATVIKN